MRKITYNDINDKFFVDNGYWRLGLENAAAYRYVIIIPTEKWRKLFDTCMAKLNDATPPRTFYGPDSVSNNIYISSSFSVGNWPSSTGKIVYGTALDSSNYTGIS